MKETIDAKFTTEDIPKEDSESNKFVDKLKDFGWSIVNGFIKVFNFCAENPIAAALIAGTATTAIQSGAKAYTAHCEQIRRERDYFDPRTGKHAIAKRKLDAYEQAFVDEQYALGKSYVQILHDMELLK